MPKESKSKRRWPAKNTDEYSEKRSQNNVAVKRSREKARLRQLNTKDRVDGLKDENVDLEHKVETLKKELSVLKDLFTSHASGAVASVGSSNPPTVQASDPVMLDHVYTKEGSTVARNPT